MFFFFSKCPRLLPPLPSLAFFVPLQPRSPQSPLPPGLLPINTLGGPWKLHTEWKESGETIHFLRILLPHFLQAPCLVSIGTEARLRLFGCPGHPGMGWAQIPGLSTSRSFSLWRITLSLRVSSRIKGFGSESMPPTTEGGDPDPGGLRLARQNYCVMK